MLQQIPIADLARRQAGLANKQRSQLLIALSLLLVVLVVVLVKDRGFWFGSNDEMEAGDVSENVVQADSTALPAQAAHVPAARASAAKNNLVVKPLVASAVTESVRKNTDSSDEPAVVTNRSVLPPLFVEVVAGDTHSTVHPGSNVAKVEIPNNSSRLPVAKTELVSLPMNAAAHERLSSESSSELRQNVESPYPALGQHTRVQGSVVLQAVVGTDGTIQDLRVISGPAILISAAQEAIRQWRFKPYLQNGQPVETVARITVNFSIRVQENG
jgi:TonB family protein